MKTSLEWKMTKISETLYNGVVKVEGTLVVILENGTKRYIPFGALDKSSEVAKQKALSELAERAAWFNLFQLAGKESVYIFPTSGKSLPLKRSSIYYTKGWSAAKDHKMAQQNAISELEEKIVFKIFKEDIHNCNWDKYFNCASIQDNRVYLCFFLPKSKQYLYITFSNESGRVFCGLGRHENNSQAKQNALFELLMVENSIDQIANNGELSTENLSYSILQNYIEFAKCGELTQFIAATKKNKRAHDSSTPLRGPDLNIEIVDVSDYVPEVFQQLDRRVYFAVREEDL